MRKIFAVLPAIVLAFAPCAAVAEGEWVFDRNPFQTPVSPHDKKSIIDFFIQQSISSPFCHETLDIQYDTYIKIYPAYAPIAHQPGMRAKWRDAMMVIDWSTLVCPYPDILDPLVFYHRKPNNRLLYCGRLSRTPVDEEERAVETAIETITRQISAGEPFATGMLINHENWSSRYRIMDWQRGLEVRLNADVEYALRLWLYQLMPGIFENTPPYDGAASYTKDLSAERRAFVEKAIEENDIARVFATTERCWLQKAAYESVSGPGRSIQPSL